MVLASVSYGQDNLENDLYLVCDNEYLNYTYFISIDAETLQVFSASGAELIEENMLVQRKIDWERITSFESNFAEVHIERIDILYHQTGVAARIAANNRWQTIDRFSGVLSSYEGTNGITPEPKLGANCTEHERESFFIQIEEYNQKRDELLKPIRAARQF